MDIEITLEKVVKSEVEDEEIMINKS